MMRVFLLVDGSGGMSVYVQGFRAGPAVAMGLMMVFPMAAGVRPLEDRRDAYLVDGRVGISAQRGSVVTVSLEINEVVGIG